MAVSVAVALGVAVSIGVLVTIDVIVGSGVTGWQAESKNESMRVSA